MNHSPWSGESKRIRAIQNIIGQKTVKTECGKRVSLSHADPAISVNCPQCLETITQREKAYKTFGIK